MTAGPCFACFFIPLYHKTNDSTGKTAGHKRNHFRFHEKFGKVISFPQTLAFWVAHNNCLEMPQISWPPDTDPHDGTRIKKISYRQCRQGVEVILFEIQGGGHTWPSGYQYLPEHLIGKTSRDIDGAEVIWDFLKQFSR